MSLKEKLKSKLKPKKSKKTKKKEEHTGYYRLSGTQPKGWELVIPHTKIVLGRSGSPTADVQLGNSTLISRYVLYYGGFVVLAFPVVSSFNFDRQLFHCSC